MPVFHYEPRITNDKSTLTPGMHPGFLLAIQDEEVPDGWKMKEKSPRMWRWLFAVWPVPEALTAGMRPEKQSATSSQTFSPGGQRQASKAYVWTCKLLGRKIETGESVDLDPMLPLPCWIMVSRTKSDGTAIEYANLMGLELWPEGAALLTPPLRAYLAGAFLTEAAPAVQQQNVPPPAQLQYAQPAPTQYAAASAPVAPGWPPVQAQGQPTQQQQLPGTPARRTW